MRLDFLNVHKQKDDVIRQPLKCTARLVHCSTLRSRHRSIPYTVIDII